MMMNIREFLDELAKETSKNKKAEMLLNYRDDPSALKWVLKYAYDPFKRFHISQEQWQRQQYTNGGGYQVTALMNGLNFLDKLSERRFTGNAALEAISNFTENMSLDNREVLGRIVGKDLRCGISAKTINKAFPGLVPEFDVMLADKFNEDKWKTYPCFVEPKLDGMRVVVFVDEQDNVQFKSRAGKDLPSLDFMADQARYIRDQAFKEQEIMLDGEVLGANFNDTVSIVRKKDTPATDATLFLFDVVTAKQGMSIGDTLKEGVRRTQFEDRRRLLEGARPYLGNNFQMIEIETADNLEQVLELYTQYRKMGLEGAIVKDPNAYYEFKRSKGWQKIKDQETHDLTVTELHEGTGKYSGMLGAVTVDYNGTEVLVGSGFSDAARKSLWDSPESIRNKVIEVEAHETTPDGSLRHPRFVRIREDKESDNE